MKRKNRISIFIMMMFMIVTYQVYAAEAKIKMTGEAEAKAGESKVLEVNVSSETAIGVISGTIVADGAIEDLKVESEGNWSLTYNEKNGKFNLLKAEGETAGKVMKIRYTIKEGATGSASISMSDLQTTSIEYNSEEVEKVTHKITIAEEKQEQQEEQLKEIENTKSDNNKETTQQDSKAASKQESNIANKNIPQTGISFTLLGIILVITINAMIVYKKYKKIDR